jgi:hypothetical protein
MTDALVWGRDDAGNFAMIGTEGLTLELAVDLMRRCLAKYEQDIERDPVRRTRSTDGSRTY